MARSRRAAAAPREADAAVRRVVVLLMEGSVLYDVGTAESVFGSVKPPIVSRRPRLGYELELAAAGGRPVRTSMGVEVRPTADLGAVARADLVVVGGAVPDLVGDQHEALDALAAAHARGARVMSICTGAFALAHAGLLDGRRATTHWGYCARLAEEFPQVDVDPDVLYVDDGDVLTSAGLAAGMDLCLHVVRGDRGADAATAVARWNVVAPHRDGGQAQFIAAPVPAAAGDSLAPTRAWALERLAEPLDVDALARHAHMSARTFARRFVAETGESPKRWLTAQRVHHARRLLETTDLPVEDVATRSGFSSAAALRIHFHRATSTRPTTYRRSFRTSDDAAEVAA